MKWSFNEKQNISKQIILIFFSPSNETDLLSFEIVKYTHHSNTATLKSDKGTNKSLAQKHCPLLQVAFLLLLLFGLDAGLHEATTN